MRFRPHDTTRTERLASLAVATCVTAAAVFVVLVALVRSEVFRPLMGRTEDGRAARERVTFLTPAPPPPAVPLVAAPIGRPSARVQTPPVLAPVTRNAPPPSSRDTASASALTAPGATKVAPATSEVRATAGAPVAGAIVGVTRPADSLMVGIGPPTFKPLPPTQAEVDKKYRDESFDAIAAHGAGVPVRRTMIGGGIPVGLPGGGPSAKQRERDRIIGAELAELRAQRQKRIDSVVAGRRRADSVARATNSSRRDTLEE
ncbi:MAG TPA: hypothetical protein VM076_09310 [Gemmatimonadaceae bacterium]|nr:hypothetical protein [Gemmatimonadaceae bacterium]